MAVLKYGCVCAAGYDGRWDDVNSYMWYGRKWLSRMSFQCAVAEELFPMVRRGGMMQGGGEEGGMMGGGGVWVSNF